MTPKILRPETPTKGGKGPLVASTSPKVGSTPLSGTRSPSPHLQLGDGLTTLDMARAELQKLRDAQLEGPLNQLRKDLAAISLLQKNK